MIKFDLHFQKTYNPPNLNNIGWDMSLLGDEDRLNRLLQTGCGCEPVDDPVYPEGSASCMDFVASEKRKEMVAKRRENKDVDSA